MKMTRSIICVFFISLGMLACSRQSNEDLFAAERDQGEQLLVDAKSLTEAKEACVHLAKARAIGQKLINNYRTQKNENIALVQMYMLRLNLAIAYVSLCDNDQKTAMDAAQQYVDALRDQYGQEAKYDKILAYALTNNDTIMDTAGAAMLRGYFITERNNSWGDFENVVRKQLEERSQRFFKAIE